MLSQKFTAAIGMACAILAPRPWVGSVAHAQEGPACRECATTPPCSFEQLAGMNWPDLECLYRRSTAGTIPQRYLRGRAIYRPGTPLTGTRSKITRLIWHGKDFCPADGTLINQWCGFRAIRARVSYGPSWLDGEPSVIMDYCGMSRVWADVRDEIREVAPGLYLGVMYRRDSPCPKFKMFFVLQSQPCAD